MGVEVDRKANLLLQCADHRLGSGRLKQARHIFKAQYMRARGFQFFGHGHVVFEVIFGAIRI